jgi:hypothetical protein
LLNRLTAIRLAQQILERRTELSGYQRSLVHLSLEACDDLVSDVLPEVAYGPASEPTALRLGVVDRPIGDAESGRGVEQAVDAVVIAADRELRRQLAARLSEHGYVVQAFESIGHEVEELLAERRRLVVMSPQQDLGQAEIEEQVRRLRAIGPRAALVLCVDHNQVRRASWLDAQTTVIGRPLRPAELLSRAEALYPIDPPRRVAADD